MRKEEFISGARIDNILSIEALNIATKLYEQFRRRDDCGTISRNTGFSIEQIQLVKYYVFFASHYNKLGEFERFTPSYDMAESWRRLSEKSGRGIKPHDILILKHELTEITILALNTGVIQSQAHYEANKHFNYQEAADNYYRSIGVQVV